MPKFIQTWLFTHTITAQNEMINMGNAKKERKQQGKKVKKRKEGMDTQQGRSCLLQIRTVEDTVKMNDLGTTEKWKFRHWSKDRGGKEKKEKRS